MTQIVEAIQAYLTAHPDARVREIAAACNCHQTTVYKFLSRYPRGTAKKASVATSVASVSPATIEAIQSVDLNLEGASGTVDLGPSTTDPTDLKTIEDEENESFMIAFNRTCAELNTHSALSQSLKRSAAAHARTQNNTFSDMEWESVELILRQIAGVVTFPEESIEFWEGIVTTATHMLVFKRNDLT